MIKFFRNIRKTLLMENNTGKPASQTRIYLKYAIGEILLVVIGILLALSINKWNEDRVNLIKANKYLETIVADIIQDSTKMSSYIDVQTSREKEFSDYFDFIKTGNIQIGELRDTLRKIKIFSGGINFTTTTYDQLIASGNFEHVPEEKRLMIIGYYTACQDILEYIESYDDSKAIENAEARKYLDPSGDKYDLFKALNYQPSKEFIIQGLKHDHNSVKLEYYKSLASIQFGEYHLQLARSTIAKLKEE